LVSELSPLLDRVKYGVNINNDTLSNEIKVDFDNIRIPPKSEIQSGREAVIRYFESLETEDNIHLNTLKIVLAGNSTVGKTSLIHWLKTGEVPQSNITRQDKSHQSPEENNEALSTLWLDVILWKYNRKLSSIDELNIRFFDFGGQAYYHDAHHIFYSANTIYLLLWNNELNIYDEKGNYPVEYWLEAIQHFSSDDSIIKAERLKSPILVIQNKVENLINKGQGIAMLNNYDLKSDFSNIYDFAAVSLTEGIRGEHLRDVIKEIIEKMDIVQETLPESRVKWMESIRKMKTQKRSILTIEELHSNLQVEYPTIEISDIHATCLRLFSIGDIILLQPQNTNIEQGEKIVFLDIDWAIRCVKEITKTKRANFTQSDFMLLTKTTDEKDIVALIELMLEFKMIIKLREEEFTNPYIFPNYLDNQPNRGMGLIIDNFKKHYIQLRFKGYFHKSIILDIFSAFKSEILTDNNDINKDYHYFWKKGLILKNSEDNKTLVLIKLDEVFEKGYSYLEIRLLEYEQGNRFIKRVYETVKSICDNWKFTEFVSPDGASLVPISLVEKNNNTEKLVSGKNSIPLSIMIYENQSYKLRDFQEFIVLKQVPLRIFISYAREDNEYATELITHLKPFERNGQIEPWLDRNLNAGEKWKDKIIESIRKAEIFLFLISPEFLASDFIMIHELKWCLDAKEKNNKIKIIPIILKPCLWEGTLGKYQAVLQGEPIELFENRDKQWVKILNQINELYQSEYRI
jgi:GTPase SAR1 family protein